MSRVRKAWRYEVTDVSGSMLPNIKVGETIIDYWHGKSHTYTVMAGFSGEVTGTFSVRLIGPHDQSWEDVQAAYATTQPSTRSAATK